MSLVRVGVVAAVLLSFGGCKDSKPAPSAPVGAAAKAEAQEAFKTRCVACHGERGAGDGAAAAALNPKPRNYSDKKWQASITDAQIEKIIRDGGASVGKSPLMPGNPDLAAKPEVIAGLREIVRSFGQ